MQKKISTKHPNNVSRLFKAFCCSLCGFKVAFQDEAAFRQEVYVSIIAIPAALLIGASAIEKAILIGSLVLVLLMELINSSIEAVVDKISLEIHPLSKKIKDIGSAAVTLSIFNAVIIWVIILTSHNTVLL